MENELPRQSDHDLLITLHTKLDRAISDIRDLNDNSSRRITTLELGKVDKTDFKTVDDDKEKRIRRLERYGAIAVGALYILELITKLK